MNFKRRLRTVCGILYAAAMIIYAVATATAYHCGGMPSNQFIASLFLFCFMLLLYIYMVIYWRD